MPLMANRLLSQNTDRCCQFFIKRGAQIGSDTEEEDYKYFKKLVDFISREGPLNPVLSGSVSSPRLLRQRAEVQDEVRPIHDLHVPAQK